MNYIDRATYQFMPKCCWRAGVATDLTAAVPFNIFDIQNGPILVQDFFGVVTTVIGAGAAVPRVRFTPTGGAAIWVGLAATTIATDAVNTCYLFTLSGLDYQLAPAANIGGIEMTESVWGGAHNIIVPGVVSIVNAVASTGIIDWYIVYRGATPQSLVAPL